MMLPNTLFPSKKPEFTCSQCGEQYTDLAELAKHEITVHSKSPQTTHSP